MKSDDATTNFLELQLPTFPRHILESANKRKDILNVNIYGHAMASNVGNCNSGWLESGEMVPDPAGTPFVV